jgi:hypothetical protein
MRDSLPPPASLRPELLEEPKQLAVRKAPLATTVNGVDYSIQPRFSYDLYGLVVSLHDSDAWWDYAHREWGDHVNAVDFCVVWGENIRRDAYKQVSWSHDQWTCMWQTYSNDALRAFDGTAYSNNHLVTDDPSIARQLRKVGIGDQVHFKGYLVDYTTIKNGVPAGMRVTSTVRNDDGPGACEVVYVEDFEILGSANRLWRLAFKASLILLLASVLVWAFLPVKFKD